MSEHFSSQMDDKPRIGQAMPSAYPAEQNNTENSQDPHTRRKIKPRRKPLADRLEASDMLSIQKSHSREPNAHGQRDITGFGQHLPLTSFAEGKPKQNAHLPFVNLLKPQDGALSKGLYGQTKFPSSRGVDTRTLPELFLTPLKQSTDSDLFDMAQKIQTSKSSTTSKSISDLDHVLDTLVKSDVSNDSLMTTGILHQLESLQYHFNEQIRERSEGVVNRFRHQLGASKPHAPLLFKGTKEPRSNEDQKLDVKQPAAGLATSGFSKLEDESWTSSLQFQHQASSSKSFVSTKNTSRHLRHAPSTQSRPPPSQGSESISSSSKGLLVTKKTDGSTSNPPVEAFGTANFSTQATGTLHHSSLPKMPPPKGLDTVSTPKLSNRQSENVPSVSAFGIPHPTGSDSLLGATKPHPSKISRSHKVNASNTKDVPRSTPNSKGHPAPKSTRLVAFMEELDKKQSFIDELSVKILNLEQEKEKTLSRLTKTSDALEAAEDRWMEQAAELRADHSKKMYDMKGEKDAEKHSAMLAMKLRYESQIEDADRKSRLYKEAQDNIQQLEENTRTLGQHVVDIGLAKATVEKECQDLATKTTELEGFEEGYKQIQNEYRKLEIEHNDLAAECEGLKEKIQELEEAAKTAGGGSGPETAGLMVSSKIANQITSRTAAAEHLDGLVHQWENQLQIKVQSLQQKRIEITQTDSEIAKMRLPAPTLKLPPTQPAEESDQGVYSTESIAIPTPLNVSQAPLGNDSVAPVFERHLKTKVSAHREPLSVPRRPSSTPAFASPRTWATVASGRLVRPQVPPRYLDSQHDGSRTLGQEEEWPVVGRHGKK